MRSFHLRVALGLLFGAALAHGTFAQQPAAKDAKPGQSPDSKAVSDNRPTGEAQLRPFEPWEYEVGPRVWMRIWELKRLHAAIEERVNLTPDQKTAMSGKFEEIIERLRKEPIISARRPIPFPYHSPERLAELQAQLAAAQKDGKDNEADGIQSEILKGTPGTNENLGTPLHDMIIEIKTMVRPDQLEALTATMDRWETLEVRTPFDGPLRMINRATKDPDLKLSPEKKAAIEQAVAQASEKMREGKRSEKLKRETGEALRAAIVGHLNDAQRKIFEEDVDGFERQAAELRAIEEHRRRHGGPNPYLQRTPGPEGPPTEDQE